MRGLIRVLGVVAWIGLVPSLAWAQGASITGVVRDASGAVLPGVTVEATSPALIEKVRSVVTDGTGQYRLADLRPGVYSVTATLSGFSASRRDGIELTGSMTATIPLELRVGALNETITVTGATPIVDVQSVRRQVSVDNEVISQIPSARAYGAIMNLIPSVANQGGTASDVQIAPNMTVFGGQGGRGNEGRLQVDGLGTGAPLNGAGVSTYIADVGNAQEVTFTTSGGLGEAEVGGPTVSIVPKTGGNTFKGQFYFAGVNDAMVGNNYDEELRAAGLAVAGQLIKLWDYNFGVGGPIKRDRLWFYGTFRDEGNYRSIPGIFPNKNAGDPTKWTYEADTTRQAQGAESWRIATLRLTLQATQRNKFNIYWDEQSPCNGSAYFGGEGCREQPESGAVVGPLGLGGLSSTTSPEVAGYLHTIQRVQQITWTSTATNRLLLEAGLGTFLARWGPQDAPGNPTRNLIRVQEQCPAATGCAANGNTPNLNYRSANWASNWSGAHRWRASGSYVTGRQSIKFGYQGAFFVEDDTSFSNINYLSYRVANGAPTPTCNANTTPACGPNQFTQTINENTRSSRTALNAFFVEEQWTVGRYTFQGAIRYDHSWSWYPEQTLGPHKWLATQVVYPRTDGVNYDDVTPRLGFAWDVFGTGRTAVKVNIGRYLEPASNGNGNYGVNNPTNRIVTTNSRSWIDADNDFVIDCDLFNQAAQDLRSSGGDNCGAGNTRFGTLNPAEAFDPALLNGWFVRPDDWGFSASIQQEVLPRVSAELQYTRRWLSGFNAQDNRATVNTDYTQYSVTAPLDPRLPNGGGYTICCMFDVNPNRVGQTDNFTTLAENFGKRTQIYNGFLLNVSARPGNGLTLQGGINTGSTVSDTCDIRAVLPETSLTNPYCENAPGFVTRVTGLAAYTVPKVDVLLSTTFRSDQGAPLQATFVFGNAAIAPSLGRNLSAGANANVTINLIEPGTEWGDRVNEIDVRIAKILRFGRTRTNIGFDVYNLINSNAILSYNQTFTPGGQWLRPTQVLTPRFVKFSAQIDF